MNPSSDDLPKSQNQLALFVFLVLFICLLLAAGEFFLIKWIEKNTVSENVRRAVGIAQPVIENLIAGAIAALLLAFTYRTIIAFIEPNDRVVEVQAGFITERLLGNARRTKNYVFIGNTASFVSSTLLPVICESARVSGHPRNVQFYLIDPMDELAVNSYVAYRDRISRGAHKIADTYLAVWYPPMELKKLETSEDVTAKIVSTIYLAAFSARHPGISVTVHLRRSFTPFRADISDREVVLTQESASESAVAFSSKGHFYSWYHKEADAQKDQVISIDLNSVGTNSLRVSIAHPKGAIAAVEEALRNLLRATTHLAPLACDPVVVSKAAKLVGRTKTEY